MPGTEVLLMDDREPLPQPTENAMTVVRVVGAVFGSVPGLSILRDLYSIELERRAKEAETILFQAITNRGVQVLSEDKFSFFVPASYAFAERVRVGEYEHNLKTIADLIAGNYVREVPDQAQVLRWAYKLQGLEYRNLVGLVRFHEAYEKRRTERPGAYTVELSAGEFAGAFSNDEFGSDWRDAEEIATELLSRGILKLADRAEVVGGTFFSKTRSFDEVVRAAETVLATGDTPPNP